MIKDNILKVRGRIPDSTTIVAVSKGRTLEQIKEAIEAGITDIGENKVQEALRKYNELSTIDYRLSTIKWHMVGHLQTNKVRQAVKTFDLIQSVDSFHLAAEIGKEARKIDKVQDILIEIKTSPEATKFGVKPDEAVEVIRKIAQLRNVRIKGLMTIAPVVGNPEETRPHFKMLKQLLDRINESRITSHELTTLSMGMTDDFEIAVQEGSNTVRLGRAIFEG
jgi:PLP dependent protein